MEANFIQELVCSRLIFHKWLALLLFHDYHLFLLNKISMIQNISQPAIRCSKLTTETLEQGVKYFQSYQ